MNLHQVEKKIKKWHNNSFLKLAIFYDWNFFTYQFFDQIFYVILSMNVRLLARSGISTYGEWGMISTKSVLRSLKTVTAIFRNQKSFVQLDTNRNQSNFGNKLRKVTELIFCSRVDLGLKYSYVQIYTSGCWGVKIAKIIHIQDDR